MIFKVGMGYDIHQFAEGRKLFLGGVEIPHSKGLFGHSDADVLLHALCDAILGALGLGDIGEHFPNTNQKYKNISSLALVEEVKALMLKNGYQISNVDCTIQAEEPKLLDYKPAMRHTIAVSLGIDHTLVNIKATTMEGLGAIGNRQGIAAFVTVLLFKK
ncbi:MAG: 2-C-methyl-D-erythritol 2,4-cyclodiphosphate synthase [Candidatus Omnitrophica bacterium]|nr:2-C-methyl-D-erythritol 2,4-cyclodiphosphate synthase [Candidatus Omnitrophota bacterium]